MRLKITISETSKHEDMCCSVAWSSSNELTSIGEDNVMLRWNVNTNQASKFMDLEGNPIDIDWAPMAKGTSDIFAVGFSDGSFKLINRNGRVDKTVQDAHKGCITSLKWSYDGGALATAGEDGALKIWSKNGNIRSNLITSEKPIYCVMWSPESDAVLYCSDRSITIKPMTSSTKLIQWKAHDGIVLRADWNPSNNLIVSCGEDCRYKVWDTYGNINYYSGRQLYSSSPYDYVVTSLSWSPNGEYFAVGAFGMFKLCDKTGWTYSFHKTNIGSIMKISWSADGTMCCGASGSGAVLFGEVVDRQLNYENWEANLNDENKIQVVDLLNEIHEQLDFKDRVINMSMCYEHLIVTTAGQCYIYSTSNWNTPQIFDLKDSVSIIIQSLKYFCLVESTNGLMIYNYEGKLVSNPKIAGAKFEFLNRKRVTMSNDIVAVIDGTNNKLIKFFELANGKPLNFNIDHVLDILEINLNQTEQTTERKIAFIDANRDLYLSPVHKKDVAKISTICDSFIWHDQFDILASISDNKLITYYYPNVVYIDKDLVELCMQSKEAPEIGRMSQMLTFTSSQVSVRRKDGGLITLGVSPYPRILFDFCDKNRWEKAIKLCRFVKEPILWACMAAVSMKARELSTAEIAFAAIQQADKIQYILKIKDLPSEVSRNAALALFFHKTQEAQQIYLQSKLYYRAIKMNIKLYHWDRALELATNYKVHLDTVVAYRKRYLERIGKEETNKKFLKVNSEIGDVDWTKIKEATKQEKEREKNMK